MTDQPPSGPSPEESTTNESISTFLNFIADQGIRLRGTTANHTRHITFTIPGTITEEELVRVKNYLGCFAKGQGDHYLIYADEDQLKITRAYVVETEEAEL
ncbi:MAG: hypothetical protein D4R45_03255 [Planctomycetaceae bacterium]|nr:MAG: hypothetical protein D4R45_03255 [Planctomycetaceae bacterium]